MNQNTTAVDNNSSTSYQADTYGWTGSIPLNFFSDEEGAQKLQVNHDYHDYSEVPDNSEYTPAFSKGGVATPFPIKLHDMLAASEADPSLAKIVYWLPHGRSFIVSNTKETTENILPTFFDQNKYASFQRQLNLYGFKRLTKGPDRGSYYHELFLRGKRFLTRRMKRMKIKGSGARLASNPEDEPNFYNMSFLPLITSIEHKNPFHIPEVTVSNNSSMTHDRRGTSYSPSQNKELEQPGGAGGLYQHRSSCTPQVLGSSRCATSKEIEDFRNPFKVEEKDDDYYFNIHNKIVPPLNAKDFSEEELDHLRALLKYDDEKGQG